MADRKPTKDLMGEALSGSAHKRTTEAPRTPHRKPTNAPQATHKSTLEKYHVRFAPEDWKLLQEHFDDQGISVSAGLRQIVREYMKRKGLR